MGCSDPPDPGRVWSVHVGMSFGSLLSFFPFAHLENSSHLQLREKGREKQQEGGLGGTAACQQGTRPLEAESSWSTAFPTACFPQSLIIRILSSQVFHYQSCCHSPMCKLSGCYCKGKCHNSKYTCRITFVYTHTQIFLYSHSHIHKLLCNPPAAIHDGQKQH